MKTVQNYSNLSRHYENLWGKWHTQHLPLLEPLLKKYPQDSKFLDLGCGTGALVERFCAMGYKAFGMDISANMIAAAASRSIPAGHLIKQDMSRFYCEHKYNFITSTFFTVNYLKPKQLDDFFLSVSMALEPGSLFYFDSCTEHLLKKEHRGTTIHTCENDRFTEKKIYDTRMRTAQTHFEFTGETKEIHFQYPYGLTDFLGSIMQAGMYVLHSYGSFKGEIYTPQSKHLICVAAKARM
ncbi:MAG: class I SAM-dependent methyltransferase [Chitinispirillales bacterium]|jgi:predicted TPR repeat methyltransferase|nr:class I SAM-dependent methyltransferase [Chitinispirillales bacterium]